MDTFFDPDQLEHCGQVELHLGAIVPYQELPERASAVAERIRRGNLGTIRLPERFPVEALHTVHAPDYVAFLQTAALRWRSLGGEGDALPSCWPVRGLRQNRPTSLTAQLGYYSFCADTPIMEHTFTAALASAQAALSAQRQVASGAHAAFALCRPPGHHAHRSLSGGYCYFNNTALAAQASILQGAGRVGVLDVDYHHGNGTQDIFYRRADVITASIHADPAHDFPYFLGFRDERGSGAGEGANHNYPLPLHTGASVWLEALDDALTQLERAGVECLIVALGVDTFEGDPLSHFRLQTPDYRIIGARIAALNRPCVFVLEGGYNLEHIGENVYQVLAGFEGA